MSVDEHIHELHKQLDKMLWRDFDNEEQYEWYYAENNLYLLRYKPTGELAFIKGKSPDSALKTLENKVDLFLTSSTNQDVT